MIAKSTTKSAHLLQVDGSAVLVDIACGQKRARLAVSAPDPANLADTVGNLVDPELGP